MNYQEDYKTDDPNWIDPPKKALTGEEVVVRFRRLHEKAQIPEYKSEEAAGMDLCSVESCRMFTGDVTVVSTGLAMSIPKGYEGQVRPRSGLAAKYGVTVLNSPGTIDSDYRGEIKVILINHGKNRFSILPGDRIAQLVISPVQKVHLRSTDSLDDTDRGDAGFGSTGV